MIERCLSFLGGHFLCNTVRPLSHMCLTSLPKCNRARWQMLFHPTVLRLEFCNPLTFGQMCISCAFYALPGWNLTEKNLLLIDNWSIPPNPLSHTSSWLVSGIDESHPPPSPYKLLRFSEICAVHAAHIIRMRSPECRAQEWPLKIYIIKFQYSEMPLHNVPTCVYMYISLFQNVISHIKQKIFFSCFVFVIQHFDKQ